MMKLGQFIKISLYDYLNEKNNILLAPNGKISNLTPDLYNLVRTDNFKKWFGDWENNPTISSKVVDQNGEPLLCYHGTTEKFNKFDENRQKIGWLGKGFYFTDNSNITNKFGKIKLAVFLNIRVPFIIKGDQPSDIKYEVKRAYNSSNEDYYDDVSITLKEHGHDGVFYKHWEQINMFTCFESSQIKRIDEF